MLSASLASLDRKKNFSSSDQPCTSKALKLIFINSVEKRDDRMIKLYWYRFTFTWKLNTYTQWTLFYAWIEATKKPRLSEAKQRCMKQTWQESSKYYEQFTTLHWQTFLETTLSFGKKTEDVLESRPMVFSFFLVSRSKVFNPPNTPLSYSRNSGGMNF